ncbi:Zinc finger C2H2 [Penicillium freii]|nr:Zinc finger C2H2 [Penicillium freii]
MLLPLKKEIDNYYIFLKVEIDRRRPQYLSDANRELVEKDLELQSAIYYVKSIIYTGVCKTNSVKKHAAISVGNRQTVSNKPTREILRKEFEILSEQILLIETFFTWPTTDLLEDESLRGRRKRSTPSDNKDVVPSPPARKMKADTQPNTSGKYIPNAKQTFAYFQCPKTYSDYNGVKRHFRTSYLTDRKCNFCDLSVLHEMHLRRHASDAHGLRT